MFRLLARLTLPVLILGGCAWTAWWLYNSKPVVGVHEIPAPLLRVEGTTLKKTVYPVVARSQGTVQPRTGTVVTAEVSGLVTQVSDRFRPGGFFQKGEMLVQLDRGDYETALIIAQATQATAEAILIEEQAKAEQAVESWKALGRTGEPNALLIRTPQVAKAQADVASAKAQVAKAGRDLVRTEIRAPYDGQVLQQRVDVGQVINAGGDLAELFSIDVVEVRLPIPERERRFLKLPQRYRQLDAGLEGSAVSLIADEGGAAVSWDGALVRVEGAVDEVTRQTIAVAQVRDPFGFREEGTPPLKIGQFVEAVIQGVTLEDVFILPRSAVRAGNEIILITEENRLHRVQVMPVAGDERYLVVAAAEGSEPMEGDVLCITPIPFPAEGMRVLPTIDGQTERPGMAGAGKASAAGKRKPASEGEES